MGTKEFPTGVSGRARTRVVGLAHAGSTAPTTVPLAVAAVVDPSALVRLTLTPVTLRFAPIVAAGLPWSTPPAVVPTAATVVDPSALSVALRRLARDALVRARSLATLEAGVAVAAVD